MGGELVEDKKFNAYYYLRKVAKAKGTLVHFHGNALEMPVIVILF